MTRARWTAYLPRIHNPVRGRAPACHPLPAADRAAAAAIATIAAHVPGFDQALAQETISFSTIYPGAFFQTNAAGSLNKATPFQLRQFLVEAGFAVTYWSRTPVANRPPAALRKVLCEADLQTATVLFSAMKPSA